MARGERTTGGLSGTASGESRGQTSLDFAVGVSIFLLTLISVFLFIPGTLSPFIEGGQNEIVTSNRIADSLSEGLLGDPATPHVLNETCTRVFFDNRSEPYCRFPGDNLTDRIGVSSTQNVNITLQSNISADSPGVTETATLCWTANATSGKLIERDGGSCAVLATIGDSPPESSGTTVTSRRIVDVNGTDATLLVEMW